MTMTANEFITAAHTPELVAFYNANVAADKQIKKFADRKTAERRCLAIFAAQDAAAAEVAAAKKLASQVTNIYGHNEHGFVECPCCGIDLRNGVSQHGDDVNGKPLRHDTHQFECLGCGGGFGALLRKVAFCPERSAGIAASWKKPEVAAARSTRTAVRVSSSDGVIAEYRSVAHAFERLGLAMNKHISFRMALKAEGAKEFGPYQFLVVSI